MHFRFASHGIMVGALLVLAGCAGNQSTSISSLPPQNSATAASNSRSSDVLAVGPAYGTSKGLLYETDFTNNQVAIYLASQVNRDANPAPIAVIKDAINQPYDVAIGKSGDAFVSNYGNSTVAVYAAGKTTHKSVITKGINQPIGVATNSSGTLFVSNYGNGTVTEYAAGSKSPTATIVGFTSPSYLVLDKNNNLYVADSNVSDVWKVPAGTTKPQRLNLSNLSTPVGVAVDAESNIWVADLGVARVNVYSPGSKSPSRIISGSFLKSPYGMNIDHTTKENVYVADYGTNSVHVFTHDGSTPYAELTNGVALPLGVLATAR